ncbi:mediator of RNA polymerase II transcription subunit 16 [Umezawaea tangerina]|uniref:mediator of RNA polymerase II transcription subunit 16 n=1 Tax=Umezawaea tangerina TaxID=84725 RepID=UPI001FE395F3|nr:mediator of RNA polymerase II transcription subunit 16 [Umezawaea tangerina]
MNTRCPACGWPVDDPAHPDSAHPTSAGTVVYRRCVCGGWLVLLDGKLLAGAGAARSTPELRCAERTSTVPGS